MVLVYQPGPTAGSEAHTALIKTLLASPEAIHAAYVAHFLCGNKHRPLRGYFLDNLSCLIGPLSSFETLPPSSVTVIIPYGAAVPLLQN